ncbi:hypothetical protein THASP1DRAFT_29775 [Thamnocephalis sphaerospora]|uniref:Protein kinase domain-containing protein n=1 Tax=Thamnocephalis sphaerospora TaxID=78915 RepID=A0A4P9XQT8_9FUNG|nr:hypothetical protein THASP1DRAFT_29775 [Thamnocephalis sphaerospora]|eukprot:RKP08417.1 hypothetical protein THASP1DRAFT_29775 [Thamnocephalis sphaerospora]
MPPDYDLVSASPAKSTSSTGSELGWSNQRKLYIKEWYPVGENGVRTALVSHFGYDCLLKCTPHVDQYNNEIAAQEALYSQYSNFGYTIAPRKHHKFQADDGIDLLHKAGFTHGNITPDTIYFRRSVKGTPTLVLMGLEGAQRISDSALPSVVKPRDYCPPEDYVHSKVDQRKRDAWMFGATIYFMINGHSPYGSIYSESHKAELPVPTMELQQTMERMARTGENLYPKIKTEDKRVLYEIEQLLWSRVKARPELKDLSQGRGYDIIKKYEEKQALYESRGHSMSKLPFIRTSKQPDYLFKNPPLQSTSGQALQSSVSLSPNYDDADVVTILSNVGAATTEFTHTLLGMELLSLELGSNLEQLEKAEQQHVEQLVHLHDYYMLPLLGQPSPQAALCKIAEDDALTGRNKRLPKGVFTALFKREDASGQRNGARTNTADASPNESGTVSTPPCSEETQKMHKQTVYKPDENSKAIISRLFEHLDSLIDVHVRFLEALKRGQALRALPYIVVPIIAIFVKQLSVYTMYAQSMVDALREFESLAFSNSKLANFIAARDKKSSKPHLRALLITIPVSCIWHYGAVLNTMHEGFRKDAGSEDKQELEYCLGHLEQIAKCIWPALQNIANTQHIATLQKRIQGISSSLLVPGQQIHMVDSIYILEDHGDESLIKQLSVYAIILTDRIVLFKVTRNRKQLNVHKMYLFANISFSFSKMSGRNYSCIYILRSNDATGVRLVPLSKELSATWRRHLKRLANVVAFNKVTHISATAHLCSMMGLVS